MLAPSGQVREISIGNAIQNIPLFNEHYQDDDRLVGSNLNSSRSSVVFAEFEADLSGVFIAPPNPSPQLACSPNSIFITRTRQQIHSNLSHHPPPLSKYKINPSSSLQSHNHLSQLAQSNTRVQKHINRDDFLKFCVGKDELNVERYMLGSPLRSQLKFGCGVIIGSVNNKSDNNRGFPC